MTRHRSTAYVKAIGERGRNWKPDQITPQFRFIVRMAYACHERGVSYDVVWSKHGDAMAATLTATGALPTPKPLPKAPRLKPVGDWKPTIWDAEYRLDAYFDSNRKRRCPGFVIAHSSGLSMVHPSDTGEWGSDDEDIRQGWLLIHAASGRGFGLTLSFKRAADALLLAASFPVDWTAPVEALQGDPAFRRAGNSVVAAFGNGYERDSAKRKLAELERAA